MVRSMYAGVAGMKANQTRMDVIGNNIANANTLPSRPIFWRSTRQWKLPVLVQPVVDSQL